MLDGDAELRQIEEGIARAEADDDGAALATLQEAGEAPLVIGHIVNSGATANDGQLLIDIDAGP